MVRFTVESTKSKPFVTQMPCSTLDIYPTVLEATGVAAKDQIRPLDGISLLPLFDHKTEARAKAIPFWNHGDRANPRPGHAALLDWPYKLHTDPAAGRRANLPLNEGEKIPAVLPYDVSKDPKETTDLAAQEPGRVKKMTAELNAWKKSVEKSLGGAGYPGMTR